MLRAARVGDTVNRSAPTHEGRAIPDRGRSTLERNGSATAGSGDPASTQHVPALDGMRAVAVLLVLLFHLQVPGFRAGFVGVDIFFVLSGFLITSLMLAEHRRTGRISLPDFWARRARRLLPALLLLLIVVALSTWATASFTERESMRGDLLATSGYVANWRFISTSSYFADTGIDSPLEHTWSLAIEEQFYLLWPLIVVAAIAAFARPRLGVATVAAVAAIISIGLLRLLWTPESIERAYMGTDARIFEPLIGGLGAAFIAGPRLRAWTDRWAPLLLGLGGAALISGIGLVGSSSTSYYLGGAVLISIATLLVMVPLWNGRGGVVGRAMGWRPFAWVGVVSYGAYLWHWPLIVWLGVRTQSPGIDRVFRQVGVIGLTFGIAAVSYYTIERPIRRRATRTGTSGRRRRRTTLIAIPISLVVVAGVSIAATRVPPLAPSEPVMMLVGDSVPLRLSVSFDRTLADRGWRLVTSVFGSCPVTGEAPAHTDGTPIRDADRCSEEITVHQNRLLRSADPDVIVWWDRWALSGFLLGDEYVRSGTPRFWRLRRQGLERTAERLMSRGSTVVFVAVEPPGVGIETRCSSGACPDWIRFQLDRYDDVTTRWNDLMRRFAAQHPSRATYVSVTDVVCAADAAPCDDRLGGVPLRPDGTHYEGAGVELAIETLLDRLAPVLDPLSPSETPQR